MPVYGRPFRGIGFAASVVARVSKVKVRDLKHSSSWRANARGVQLRGGAEVEHVPLHLLHTELEARSTYRGRSPHTSMAAPKCGTNRSPRPAPPSVVTPLDLGGHVTLPASSLSFERESRRQHAQLGTDAPLRGYPSDMPPGVPDPAHRVDGHGVMSWPGFARALGIIAGLAGLFCWFHDAWPETAALAPVVLTCGGVLLFEDGSQR